MTQEEVLYIIKKLFKDELRRWQFEYNYVKVKNPEAAAKILLQGETLTVKTDSYETLILNKQSLEEGFNRAIKYLSVGIQNKKTKEEFKNISTWPLDRIHIAMVYAVYNSIEEFISWKSGHNNS